MNDKQLTYQVDGKLSESMSRMMKQFEDVQKRTLLYQKESIKFSGIQLKNEKELFKLMKDQGNKVLADRKKLMQDIGKEIDLNTRRYKTAEQVATRYADRMMGRLWSGPGMNISSEQFAAKRQAYISDRMSAIRSSALRNISAGGGVLTDLSAQHNAAAMDKISTMYQMVQMGHLLNNMVGAVGQTYFGFEASKMGFKAGAASLAGELYQAGTSGNYIPFFNILNNPAQFRKVAQNAASGNILDYITRGAGVGLNAAGSAALTYGSFKSAGLGRALLAQPAAQMGSQAVQGAGSLVSDIFGGKSQAVIADAVRAAIGHAAGANPVTNMQVQALVSGRSMLHEYGALSGQRGTEAFQELAQAVRQYGMTGQEALPLVSALRGILGQGLATSLAPYGAGALDSWGISRQAALGAMGTFGTTMRGSGGGNNAAWATGRALQFFHNRQMDAGQKEMLLGGLGGLTQTYGGASGLGFGQMAGSLADIAGSIAGSWGRGVTSVDVGSAAGAIAGFGTATSGSSGRGLMDVLAQGAKSSAFRSAGLSNAAIVSGMNLSAIDIMQGTQRWQLFKDANNINATQEKRIRTELAGQLKGIPGRLAPGMSIEQAALAYTEAGGDVNRTLSEFGIFAQGGLRAGVVPDEGADVTAKASGSQAALRTAGQADAYARQAPLMQALQDPKMLQVVTGTMIATAQFVKDVGDVGSKADLTNVPEVLGRVVDGLKNLKTVLNEIAESPFMVVWGGGGPK